jgi:outer membrane lipoprotein carrier protein
VELLMALGLAVTLAAPEPALSPAQALARRVEARHRSLADLKARFAQSYRSGMLGREVVERGTVALKPPGRMLWEYRDPERKTFVSDGRRFYFYVPADRQVIVREQADMRGIPALLLSGRGDVLAQFAVAFDEKAPPGRQRLVLVPKKADPEVDQVILDVDATDRIRGIVVRDTQGNRSRFEFEDIQENVGLKDRLFEFKVPQGVEVITG